MIDLFSSDFIGLNNDQRYSAIVDFARVQPLESNRHDFKLIWNNDGLKDVAAFANTFGGILVIGVEKNQSDPEAKVSGVESNSELTTGIASAIATNISPTPSYDIMECHKTGETNRRFCVIRVRSDSTLYIVTKKAISSPVWIRNADQTVAADAAQLRRMIDREKQFTPNVSEVMWNRAHALFEEMIIGCNYAADTAHWTAGSWNRSETYFKVAIIPTERTFVMLDGRSEHRFNTLIHQNYRRIRSTLGGSSPVSVDAQNRSADFFEYRWYHKNLDLESRWRISQASEVAHSIQIKQDEKWSLVDVVFYIVLLLRITAEWWESLNYFGDGLLCADLKVDDLPLARGSSGQFLTLFDPAGGGFGIRQQSINVHAQQRREAQAYDKVNFSSMRENVPQIVTSLMNVLVRSLGHNLFCTEFEDDLRAILAGSS